MPVTTVPEPGSVKQRSTARRKGAVGGLRAASPAPRGAGASRRASTPAPVTEETGRISAPSMPVPMSALAMPLCAAAMRSASAMSILVSATRPRVIAEQVEDRQVLAGLRHHPVVGGDDEQREVDAAGAGQHVVHQPLVAGHVDEADHRAVRRRHVGEAEVDGDAARLLLLQPVGVDAGQRPHQAGLAVVDVAGGADDHGAGSGSGWSASRRARPASSSGSAASAARRNG